MGKKNKYAKEAAPAPPPPEKEELESIHISDAPLPLLELEPQVLGELLELCFPDKRLLELCAELRLYSPGYRIEAMPINDCHTWKPASCLCWARSRNASHRSRR